MARSSVAWNTDMTDQKSTLWGAAETYERYMGRWSRKVAPLFVDWLDAPQGKSWADIGCGTGELSLQIAGKCKPSHLIGIDTSPAFITEAARYVPNAEFRQGDATNIDLPDEGLDYAVSGLVLNFIPDKAKALREMVRIVRPGGTVGLYVWDYAGHMQIMRYFFDSARLIDPNSSVYDDGINAPICRPKPLLDAFIATGLSDAETTAIDIPAAFVDFQDYWTPFLGGTGSAPKYCMSLDEGTRNKIRDALRERLPTGPDGEILLAVRAWAVKGYVPA
jgi:trans-aconitate methyltransferase